MNTQTVRLRQRVSELKTGPFGSALSAEEYVDEGVPVINPSDLRDGRIWADEAVKVPESVAVRMSAYRVECGDVVLGRRGELGRYGLVGPDEVGFLCGTGSLLVRPNSELDARYFGYYLETREARNWLSLQSVGSTMENLSEGILARLPMPNLARLCQTNIANFLDDKTTRIDALIAEKERLAESIKDIEEVTAFDLVTRGLGSNVPLTSFSEPWLKEVPRHWGLAKLRNIAIVGNGSTPKRDNEAYWAGGSIPWLNSGSVNSSRIVEASDYVTTLAVKECHLPTVRAGSTVIALTGQGKTRGRAALVEFETTINQHLAFVSPIGQSVSDEYLWVALTGFYSVFRHISDGEGSTKGALTCEELNRFRIPVPPPEEQSQILSAYVQRIQSIDKLKEHNKLHIERLREYRSSLISAAVTGQLDVGSFTEAA